MTSQPHDQTQPAAQNGARQDYTALFPTQHIDTVYHVGSMDVAQRRPGLRYGGGLSVSVHPNAWKIIGRGRIKGSLWRLTRDSGAFLDVLGLTDELRERLIAWAEKSALLERSDWVPGGLRGTEALWKRVGVAPDPLHTFDMALLVFIENRTGFDGLWWNEPIDARAGGDAPHGLILAPRIADWAAEMVPDTQAPDVVASFRTPAPPTAAHAPDFVLGGYAVWQDPFGDEQAGYAVYCMTSDGHPPKTSRSSNRIGTVFVGDDGTRLHYIVPGNLGDPAAARAFAALLDRVGPLGGPLADYTRSLLETYGIAWIGNGWRLADQGRERGGA